LKHQIKKFQVSIYPEPNKTAMVQRRG